MLLTLSQFCQLMKSRRAKWDQQNMLIDYGPLRRTQPYFFHLNRKGCSFNRKWVMQPMLNPLLMQGLLLLPDWVGIIWQSVIFDHWFICHHCHQPEIDEGRRPSVRKKIQGTLAASLVSEWRKRWLIETHLKIVLLLLFFNQGLAADKINDWLENKDPGAVKDITEEEDEAAGLTGRNWLNIPI